jgi:hypothetical protein
MKPSLMAWEDIHRLAEKACKKFKLRWPIVIEPLQRKHARCSWQYGECVVSHCESCTCRPVIRLRLRNGRPLQRPAIVAVLAHELAHLKQIDAGSAHRSRLLHDNAHADLTRAIAAYFEEQGYPYTPHMLIIPRKERHTHAARKDSR